MKSMPLKIHVYGVFSLATFANSHMHKIILPEAHFHAESIGTSPVKIARKTAKLFKFLQGPTQRKRTVSRNKNTRRLPYYERNGGRAQTTLNLLHDTVICNRCRVVFLSFFPPFSIVGLNSCLFILALFYFLRLESLRVFHLYRKYFTPNFFLHFLR